MNNLQPAEEEYLVDNLCPMTWKSFKETLIENPDKILQFEYADGQFVDPSYHITEIKQAPVVSVDCGGVMNTWTEIIVQLWEPSIKETDRAMKVSKALSIISLVEKSLPLKPLGIVKIEFGNSKFDTRQMYPGEFLEDGDAFTVSLVPDFTQCKALTRNGSCGTSTDASCCTPAAKTPVVTEVIGSTDSKCTPGGGCC